MCDLVHVIRMMAREAYMHQGMVFWSYKSWEALRRAVSTCSMLFHSPAETCSRPRLTTRCKKLRQSRRPQAHSPGSQVGVCRDPCPEQTIWQLTKRRVRLESERVEASVRILAKVVRHRHQLPMSVKYSARHGDASRRPAV